MHRRPVLLAAAAVILGAAPALASAAAPAATKAALPSNPSISRVCALAMPGRVACDALLNVSLSRAERALRPHATGATPSGYGPSQLQSAYKLPSATAGTGQTVAIVDAYDDPNAASDLGVYRSQYGLPACTAATGCFRKVNEYGGSTPPSVDTGWAQEESLDIDMVSAICPNCSILLVEAASATDADLEQAENEAAALGATEISNSYGGSEASTETSENPAFNHPGIAITVSAGDSGYGVEFPAAVPTVTAVGGTSLSTASNARGWTETVWGSGATSTVNGGTGSGCSSYEPKPSYQKDTACTKRTVADVSAVADPNTGVAVYDSTADSSGNVGWLVFGGTSVSSPIIGAVYALAGNAATVTAAYPYSHTSALNDVTSGSNGSCGSLLNSSKKYLCTAQAGYDGPTGLGTPNGIGAF